MAEQTIDKETMWVHANSLLLNMDKTQTLYCSLLTQKSCQIEKSVIKILGLSIDSSLTWSAHIEVVCVKLSRVIFLLRSLIGIVPGNYVKVAYYAFFQSVLNYGLIMWGNSSHINKVLLLQKKALRIINKTSVTAHCKPLFVNSGILTVVNLYIYLCLSYVHKISTSGSAIYRSHTHDYNTRNRNLLDIPYNRLTKSQNSYAVISLKLYNNLSEASKQLTYGLFKKSLHKWLVQNPFYDINEYFSFKCISF